MKGQWLCHNFSQTSIKCTWKINKKSKGRVFVKTVYSVKTGSITKVCHYELSQSGESSFTIVCARAPINDTIVGLSIDRE